MSDGTPLPNQGASTSTNRRIRVFVSSTFRDMIAERDELMTHAWPELRRLCQERHVELVEVDLRWGIAEEQSTRKETLKLCLDEIKACRPFFVGLLGERYGWVPGDDAFTADLTEEQPWLRDLHGKSVTELEILHGVLNNPDMAGRAFFYFRDPKYVESVPADKRADFSAENAESAEKLKRLKELIRARFGVPPSGGSPAPSPAGPAEAGTPNETPRPRLHENYPDPRQLAALVLEDLKAAIEAQFPKEEVPDPLTREAQDHEAFAEIRRRTYVGRTDYFEALDRHASGDGGPLVLLGDSGSGKSALLANWLAHWRKDHPKDFILQHYIGGTADSADHWRLMTRLMTEIKRWSGDSEAVPTKHEDMLKDFPLWLAKARARATHQGVRFILVLDALNQLDDQDHARLLGWLPEHPFTGPLRLIVSTLQGKAGADDPLEAIKKRRWQELRVQLLTVEERRRMIADYLARFGKKLDEHRLTRLASAAPAANPLYLKILLDDLRVTGTYDRLDERLTEYLTAADIPTLLKQVLARYQRDYERDRPGLVGEALGLIWAARRGLTETELLRLLKPSSHSAIRTPQTAILQLPPALWTPLRAALEDSLIDRGGILNFAHDFLRMAVEAAFVADQDKQDDLRIQLADFFEAEPISVRTCDELPWLLWHTELFTRLRACLLDIDRFLLMQQRDENELLRYWVWLGEERTMGKSYLASFKTWADTQDDGRLIAHSVAGLAYFLAARASLYAEAEPLMRQAIVIDEQIFGANDHRVARDINNLARLLHEMNRLAEAEPLMRRALTIDERSNGPSHPDVARDLNNLGGLLRDSNRLHEAEPLMRRSMAICEKCFGPDHPNLIPTLESIADLLSVTNRLPEAETLLFRSLGICERNFGPDHPECVAVLNALAILHKKTTRITKAELFYRRALALGESSFGPSHPKVATTLSNFADLLHATSRQGEAEALLRRAISISEQSLGPNHPETAIRLNNLAMVLQSDTRVLEAESFYRRALAIDEQSFAPDHPSIARDLSNLASLLQVTDRLAEAEPLMRRALTIDERSYGPNHPDVARDLNNLASVLGRTNRLTEAEPLMRRALEIVLEFTQSTGHSHPHLQQSITNYGGLLMAMGQSQKEAQDSLEALLRPFSMSLADGNPDTTPSPKLQAVLDQLKHNPSKVKDILAKLHHNDPDLFMEFDQWIQSQQS